MRYFFSLLIITSVSASFAQSPGGIAANNTMWLRSDVGLTSAANVVSQWQEISGAAVTGNFTVQPITGTVTAQTGPTVVDAGINFNPYVRFDGITNSLSGLNVFPGTSLVSNNNVTVLQVFNLKGGIVWLKWETDQVGMTGRLGFENGSGNIRFDFPIAVTNASGQNGQNVGNINVLNKHSLSTAFADATISVNRLNGADNTTINNPGTGDFSIVNDKVVIGNENLLNLPAQIDMAEVIIYSRTLSAAERNKVESYLAVKYGFTLNQAAVNANNYTASDGTIIWDRAANSAYANDITGIGRDDASGLNQKQSKSINSSALLTIANQTYTSGILPTVNSANPNNFSDDKSFVLIGDNGGSAAFDQCIFNNTTEKIQRIWKVSRKGLSSSLVTIMVDPSTIPAAATNILVSQDPSFPIATTTIYSFFSAGGNLFKALPLNDNDYFTLATPSLAVGFNTTEPTCTNPTGGNVITTVVGGNPPYTYSWSPTGQTTANLTNAGVGIHTLTLTHGGCHFIREVTLISPASPASPLANNASVCPGSTGTLTVQSPNASYTYNWYAAATGGTALGTGTSFTTPIISAATTYYVEAVNGACVSIRTAVAVSLATVTGPVVNPVTVCTGTTAILAIQGPNASYTYNWYAVSTGGTALGTGTSFTTPALAAATTYYVETINGTCVSIRTAVLVSITVTPVPVANGTTVCAGSTATLTIQSSNASYTYNWYAVSTGGTALGTGTSFTTPALTTTTTYYAEAVNGTCPSIRTTVIVNITTIPAPAANPASVCPGNTATLIVNSPLPAYTYGWYATSTGGIAFGTGISFTTPAISAATNYYLEASNGTCNSIRTAIQVSLMPPLDTPRVTASTILPESITFSWPPVAGALGYQVSVDGGTPGSPSSGSTGLSHTVSGLEHSQIVTISVIALGPPPACGDSDPGHAKGTTYGDGFYVPSAFTPNGDTRNDVLTPVIPGGFILDYFTVFNRWGEKIFSTKMIGAGWDGSWQNKKQPMGTYVWMCRYHYPGGRLVDEKGAFMLLR